MKRAIRHLIPTFLSQSKKDETNKNDVDFELLMSCVFVIAVKYYA